MKSYIFSLFACIATACNNGNGTASANNKDDADTTVVAEVQKKAEVTLAFTGDVMMGTNFPSEYITKDRGKSLFKDCDSIMRNADCTIINLEGTCYDGTDGELRQMTNPNTYYIFRMPGDHVQNLVNAGVDAVGCANNHSFDFGMTGRKNTLKTMHDAGIQVAGIRDLAEGCVVERDGIKFSYIAFAASCTKVLDMLNINEVDSMINKYKQLGDILIVSFHGGAEGAPFQHVPFKDEVYVGEKRGNVHAFAHHCIDKGADVVIGHGPHVPRAVELYNGHFIAYSLGNFCTPFRMGTSGAKGYAPLLQLQINTADGKFTKGKIHSLKQYDGVGPRADSTNAAAQNIRSLTKSDFPNTDLIIEDDGEMYKR